MSKAQRKTEIGNTLQSERESLEEALRVNRALLVKAQGDRDYEGVRIAREQKVIVDATDRIAEIHAEAASAPERIARISARIAEQEAQLKALVETQQVVKKDGVKLEQKISKLEWDEFQRWRKAQKPK